MDNTPAGASLAWGNLVTLLKEFGYLSESTQHAIYIHFRSHSKLSNDVHTN